MLDLPRALPVKLAVGLPARLVSSERAAAISCRTARSSGAGCGATLDRKLGRATVGVNSRSAASSAFVLPRRSAVRMDDGIALLSALVGRRFCHAVAVVLRTPDLQDALFAPLDPGLTSPALMSADAFSRSASFPCSLIACACSRATFCSIARRSASNLSAATGVRTGPSAIAAVRLGGGIWAALSTAVTVAVRVHRPRNAYGLPEPRGKL